MLYRHTIGIIPLQPKQILNGYRPWMDRYTYMNTFQNGCPLATVPTKLVKVPIKIDQEGTKEHTIQPPNFCNYSRMDSDGISGKIT